MNSIDTLVILVLCWVLSVFVGCTGWQMTLRVDDIEGQSKVSSYREGVVEKQVNTKHDYSMLK